MMDAAPGERFNAAMGAMLQERGAALLWVQWEEVQHCDGCDATRVPVPAVTHPWEKRWPGRAR